MQTRAQGAAATCTENEGGEDQDKNEGGEDQDKNEGGDDAVQERLGKLVHICCQLLNAHTHTHTHTHTHARSSSFGEVQSSILYPTRTPVSENRSDCFLITVSNYNALFVSLCRQVQKLKGKCKC